MDRQIALDNIKSIFDQYELEKIYFIDDALKTLEIHDLLGYASDLKKISYFECIDIEKPKQIYEKQIREIWDSGNHKEISDEVKRILNDKFEDMSHLSMLSTLMGEIEFVGYKALSFSEWKKLKEYLIGEAETVNTLFLFDQDLSKDGGSFDSGIIEIKDVLNKSEKCICGILSHLYEDAKACKEEWEKYTDIKENFIITSKRFLEDDKLADFHYSLRLTLLNKLCDELKERTKTEIETANEYAFESLVQIDIYDFEHFVFKRSSEEGILETDSLLRIFNIHQREELFKKIRSNAVIIDKLNKIRKISQSNESLVANDYKELYELQHKERYESKETLNELFLPIDLGDIFEKGTKKYILLSQPCDLMLRNDGRRKLREFVTLIEIHNEEKYLQMKENDNHFSFRELKYFDENKKYVNLNTLNTHNVCILILDLCSMNSSGESEYKIDQDRKMIKPESKFIIPSLEKRFEIIAKICNKHISDFDSSKRKGCTDILAVKVIPNDILFKRPEVTGGKVKYTCKRIGRLRRPYSEELLKELSYHMARGAFDMEI